MSNDYTEEIISNLSRVGFDSNIYDDFRDNKEVVMEAVKKDGYALGYASDRLKDDKEVVLEAINQNAFALRLASDRLKDDKEVVLEAIKEEGYWFEWGGDRIKNDKDFILEYIDKHDGNLDYIGKSLQNDKEVVLAAIKRDPDSFCYAGADIKALCTESGLKQTGSYLSDEEAILVNDVLTTAIDLEKEGYKVNPNISIYSQKESFDMASTLKEELNAPKVEEKSAKDKYLEDFARQNQGVSRTKSGTMKI